jgi:hypothetical protein
MKLIIKILNIIFVIILLFLLIFFVIQKKPKIFDGSRVKIVDNIGQNYFIRGSNPFVEKLGDRNFSYHDLKKQINLTINKSGKKTLDDFYLVDLNLLNFDGIFQILDEELFFKKNPQLGSFVKYSEISPALLLMIFSNNQLVYEITKNYHQNIDKILQKINDDLLTISNKPVVIYLHCNAGRDRTGFITASYRMKYLNQNLSQALLGNITDVGRNPEYFLYSAIISYCHYLKNQKGLSEDFCKV